MLNQTNCTYYFSIPSLVAERGAPQNVLLRIGSKFFLFIVYCIAALLTTGLPFEFYYFIFSFIAILANIHYFNRKECPQLGPLRISREFVQNFNTFCFSYCLTILIFTIASFHFTFIKVNVGTNLAILRYLDLNSHSLPSPPPFIANSV